MHHTASNDTQSKAVADPLSFGQPARPLSSMSLSEMALQAACARASVGLPSCAPVRYVPVRLRRKG